MRSGGSRIGDAKNAEVLLSYDRERWAKARAMLRHARQAKELGTSRLKHEMPIGPPSLAKLSFAYLSLLVIGPICGLGTL